MPNIDPVVAQKFQPELLSGESIYWAGMPNPSVIFHSDDWYMIPFSLLWGGFAIFWEASVLGLWGASNRHSAAPSFFVLWGIPFIVIGQYMIWGRFIVDAWYKRRTYYAVTNRRAMILQDAWKTKSRFVFLESITELSREGTSLGSIWLGPKLPVLGGRGSNTRGFSRYAVTNVVPVLSDLDDVDSVYRLILDLREKSRQDSSKQFT